MIREGSIFEGFFENDEPFKYGRNIWPPMEEESEEESSRE